ncbi:hypothetical protein [Ralstonia mannitolilytica]|uniref:hypothetical protein n=1 Tax=Ralstonia mannitolilytica TaxID=105219 RepID=UPI0028F69CC7|nr:hypothetical protein [Ralstonia mannitolilytica]CAJ0742304.1 hypothetical protein R76696_03914 [Ralstonia mannitolilytica]
MKREAYRQSNELLTDEQAWDACVAHLIGPVVTPADREQQRSNALALEAAVQRAVHRLTK